jgi:hypothetical protein
MSVRGGVAKATRRFRPPRPWDMERERRPPGRGRDLEVGPPDFVGIGAQKCGTSWWYSLLSRHPLVFSDKAVHKERHFFERYWNRAFGEADVERYYQWFRRPPGQITGEWTPDYMARSWVPPLLVRAVPDAKFLVMLRDPMRRLTSGVDHYVRRETPITPWLISDIINRGRYGDQLATFLGYIDQGRLLVLQYEACVRDPVGEMARTTSFLGLPSVCLDLSATARSRPPSGRDALQLPNHLLERARSLYLEDRSLLLDLCPDLEMDLWAT